MHWPMLTTLQSIRIRLWNQDAGQDISEYSLLLAFILLVSLCLYLQNARDVSAVWNAATQFFVRGGQVVSGS
jgi:hypothetical protein